MFGQESVGRVQLRQMAHGRLKFDELHKGNSAGPLSRDWCASMVYSGQVAEMYSSRGHLQQQEQ